MYTIYSICSLLFHVASDLSTACSDEPVGKSKVVDQTAFVEGFYFILFFL